MKKLLITGATGGLGRNAVSWALDRGIEVCATGRNAAVLDMLRAQGAFCRPADLSLLSDAELDSLVAGCDTVWHCAGLASPWGAYADFFRANVLASENLYRAAMRQQCQRFVFISSPSIYFDYTSRCGIPESFRPARYVNHYANTKAQAEERLTALADTSGAPQLVHLRPRALFGPYDQVLLPRLLALTSARNGYLPLPNGGNTLLDMTYIENVVHAMALASEAPVSSGSVFNVTNGEPVVLRDVLGALFKALGSEVKLGAMPYPLMAAAAYAAEAVSAITRREPTLTRYGVGALAFDMTLDISCAREQLGYAPVVSMEKAIELTAEWFNRHG